MKEEELNRIKRVADQMISAHAVLRDRYFRRALILDILILASSVWLTGMAFIDPKVVIKIYPSVVEKDIWIGLLALVTFFLSLIQLRVNWKGLAEAHNRACQSFSSVKKDVNYLLSLDRSITESEYQQISDKYDTVGQINIAIPETKFVKLKGHHKVKVEISRYLDKYPGSSIILLRLKIWCRDNIGWCRLRD